MNVNGAKPNDGTGEGQARSCSPPSSPSSVTIFIEGTPVPKPTQTQRDKWKKREVVERYRAWCDRIRYGYIAQCGRMWERVALTFWFAGHSSRCDLSNLVKSIEDALKNVAWADDNVKHIPMYDGALYMQVSKDQAEGLRLVIRNLKGEHDGTPA